MFARPLALAGLFATLAGCGVGEATVDDGSELALEGEDELSARSQTYVTLRQDVRRCMAPLCGGFFVADVNRVHLNEKYVSALDFSLSGLSAADADLVRYAPTNELVLRGKLGPLESQFKTRTFLVTEAYRGMPGVQAAAGELFYKAAGRSPVINCFTAPCNNEVATKLNYTSKTYFTGYAVDRASLPLVDGAWLQGRVQAHGAVVAARFSAGAVFAGGAEKLLDASQVFIRLPERIGPCPMPPVRQCPSGTEMTFTRSADRCVLPAGCVTPGMCAMYLPSCAEGYTLSSWRVAPFACSQYACDPSFAVP